MYARLYHGLVYPLYHTLIGSGALEAIRTLEGHDKLTTDELRDVTREKLELLLSEAVTNVPYYRRVFGQHGADAGTLADPARFTKLPTLARETIRDNFDAMQTEVLGNNRLDPNSTSGSSGSPLRFLTDTRSKAWRKAAQIRNNRWIGIEPGDPVAHLWGSAIDEGKAQSLRGLLHGIVTRETFMSAYSASDEDLHRYAGLLNSRKCRLLTGYPSMLARFSRFVAEHEYGFPHLDSVVVSAEVLLEDQRETIEKHLGVPVFNRYGCREVGGIAHEVPGEKGLLVNADRILLEIVDEAGEPCPPGQSGRFLVTDLDNYGMPLIRYEIGDTGSWLDPAKKTGRLPYPVLATVGGRQLDVVRTPSGNRVGGTFWTILLRSRPGIETFQVVQHTLDGVEVRYIRAKDTEALDLDYFREKAAVTCGQGFSLDFVEVPDLLPEPGGKFRVVISHLGEDD